MPYRRILLVSLLFLFLLCVPLQVYASVAFSPPSSYDQNDQLHSGDKKTKHPEWISFIGYPFLIALTFGVALFVWNYSLRRKVNTATAELRNAAAALNESEKRYRKVVEGVNSIILRWDNQGLILYMNDYGLKLFGYTPEELIGRHVIGTIVPETESTGRDLQTMIEQLTRNPEKFTANENENVCKNGERIWIAWSNRSILDENGTPVEILSVGNDIRQSKAAEERLRESEEKFRAFMDNNPAIAWAKDDQGRYVYINRAYEEKFGVLLDDCRGKTDMDLLPPDLALVCQEHDRNLLRENKVLDVIEKATFIDGTTHYNRVFKFTFGHDSGKKYIGGIAIDITEQFSAEELLRQNESSLRGITNNLPGVPYQFYARENGEYGLYFVGDRAADILGLDPSPQDFFERFLVCIPEEDRENFLNTIADSVSDCRRWDYTGRFQKPTGETMFVRGLSDPEAFGDEIRFSGLLLDVTDRVLSEQALRESEGRFQDLYENSPDPCWLIERGMFVDCNQAAVRILGYQNKADVLQRYPWQHSPESQLNGRSSMEKGKELLDKALAEGICRFEWDHVKANGEVFPTEVTLASTVIHGEKILYCTWRDITERKKIEAERLKLEDRLKRSEKMEALGTMAGGVAHDLNNVLGILGGYSELLMMELPDNSPLKVHVSNIIKSAHRGAAIIQDLLTLARRGVVVSEIVNLNKVLSEYLMTPEFHAMKAERPYVKINTALEADLLSLKGSVVHLGKTVMNLVANAMEAVSDNGEITITTQNQYIDRPVRGYEEVREGEYVVLTVEDNGKGISAKDISKIFEPFYTRKVMGRSGTGLGLAVVWGTVKDHNGYIDVQSEEGVGSTFSLYFPATREEMAPQPLEAGLEEYQGKGETLLVVDDVEGQRSLATRMLTKIGYVVHAVASGEEALIYLKTQKVDLLILDMIMDPGMDGLETYQRVLEIEPRQKVVIVSGFSETERVRQVQVLGAGAYVRKPYTLKKIAQAVRMELDR